MNLVQRAKNIVLTPQSEWQAIAVETTTTADLYKGYIAPLAAVGVIAAFVGFTLIGVSIPFMGAHRMSPLSGLSSGLVSYVLMLVGVYVLSLIIDALAPTFGGEKNQTQALKLAAYSYTPAWVAGVLQILPVLSILVMLGSLYGIYLLYLGLPVLMKSPKEKAIPYTVVVMVCAIVIGAVFGAVTGAVGGLGAMPMR